MAQPLPMTRGRIIALAIGAPLALGIFAWNAFSAVAWAGQGSYRVNVNIPAHGRTATLAVDSGPAGEHRRVRFPAQRMRLLRGDSRRGRPASR